MSVNVIYFPRISQPQQVKKVEKVKLIPNLFTNLLNQYKKRQDELKQRKIDFLKNEAFKYFYDLLETPQIADVDLPEFIYEEQRRRIAYENASRAMLDVIANNAVEECYKKRIQEIKLNKKRK